MTKQILPKIRRKATGSRKITARGCRRTEAPAAEVAPKPERSGDVVPHAPGLRAGSKQARLAGLTYRPLGASIDELTRALGWQPHTVRAAITGLRKRGYAVTSSKRQDGTSAYHALPPAAGAQAGSVEA